MITKFVFKIDAIEILCYFSQQQHLADYKMKQNLNRVKNSTSTCSRSGTEDNFSPSILGSLENEVQWTNSSNQSSPPRKLRQYPGVNSNDEDSASHSLEDNRKPVHRENDLNLIDKRGEINIIHHSSTSPPRSSHQHQPPRDPYASEEFVVEAEGKTGDLSAKESLSLQKFRQNAIFTILKEKKNIFIFKP